MKKNKKFFFNDVNGILLLDKSSGISSNNSLQRVKRIYNARKAGHTGSLDVPATGLLPICFGEATKISGYILGSDKKYYAKCKLGETTTTGDASGDLLEKKEFPAMKESELIKILTKFIGNIEQVPPMFSALKYRGVRLYKFAYKGITVERKARNIKIYDINLLNVENDYFEMEVFCSKGTYIRTLVEDIGIKIGCGAHVLTLRRKETGPFHELDSFTLEKIEEISKKGLDALFSLLLPMDMALKNIPQIQLKKEEALSISQGRSVVVDGLPDAGELRIYNSLSQFIGMGEVTEDGRVSPKRLINIA